VSRAQSNVVGVAILLGVTVVALGTLTASVGTVVDQHAAASDSRRVAADLDSGLAPVETTGVRRGEVTFTSGDLDLLQRDVRVLDTSGVVARVEANALRFSSGGGGATYLAGSVLTHGSEWSQTRTAVPVAADPDVLVVSVPALRGDVSLSATGGASYTLRSNVTHHRRSLGEASYRIAVETTHPTAVRRQFERLNASVTSRDIDGDGMESVVADFSGVRTAYLVVHETEVAVS
jgi:flagellin-like protein